MIRTFPAAGRRAASRIGTLVGAGVLAIGIAGCSGMSPVTVIGPYEPSDGVSIDLDDGQVALRNLLVIGAAEGQPATVIGAVVNRGAEPVTVAFTTDLAAETQFREVRVNVPGRGTVQLGPGQRNQIPIPELPVRPGDVMGLTAATAQGGPQSTEVPVLPPEGPYASITVAPQPTGAATPSPSDTVGEPGTGSQGGPLPTNGASITPTGPNSEEQEPTATSSP